jgi:arginine/lysine/ornithine decarboxylase
MELRQGIADNLFKRYNVKYDPATEIIATVGVSEALYLAFNALLDPGDEVIIPTPCFVSYQAEVYLAGGVPVEVPSRGKQLLGRPGRHPQSHHAAHQSHLHRLSQQPDRGRRRARDDARNRQNRRRIRPGRRLR